MSTQSANEKKAGLPDQRRDVARHILPTASNMLGICFAIFSFTKLSGRGPLTSLEDCVAVTIILFLFSTLFSYSAIRSRNESAHLEKIADTTFILGVLSLFVIVIVFSLTLLV